MLKITIPKTEYTRLKREAGMFRQFASRFFELTLDGSIEDVVTDFQKTALYSKEFLQDLESGLRASTYHKRYAHSAATKRSQAVSRGTSSRVKMA